MARKKITVNGYSERLSFEGWNFLKLLRGNWKTIKELFKIGLPLILGLQFIQGNPALIGLITVVGKLVLDAGDFYLSKVKL